MAASPCPKKRLQGCAFPCSLNKIKKQIPLYPPFSKGEDKRAFAHSFRPLFERARQAGGCPSWRPFASPPLEKGATGDLLFALRRARSRANPLYPPFPKGEDKRAFAHSFRHLLERQDKQVATLRGGPSLRPLWKRGPRGICSSLFAAQGQEQIPLNPPFPKGGRQAMRRRLRDQAGSRACIGSRKRAAFASPPLKKGATGDLLFALRS